MGKAEINHFPGELYYEKYTIMACSGRANLQDRGKVSLGEIVTIYDIMRVMQGGFLWFDSWNIGRVREDVGKVSLEAAMTEAEHCNGWGRKQSGGQRGVGRYTGYACFSILEMQR